MPQPSHHSVDFPGLRTHFLTVHVRLYSPSSLCFVGCITTCPRGYFRCSVLTVVYVPSRLFSVHVITWGSTVKMWRCTFLILQICSYFLSREIHKPQRNNYTVIAFSRFSSLPQRILQRNHCTFILTCWWFYFCSTYSPKWIIGSEVRCIFNFNRMDSFLKWP